jgi:putative aldouronate transport system permease protein
MNRGGKSLGKKLWDCKTLILMCGPAILFFIVFAYIPMPGAYIAFTDFKYNLGIFGSRFVGLENFRFLVISGKLWQLTRNTILYNMAFIFLGNALQIFVALLLNEIRNRWFKKSNPDHHVPAVFHIRGPGRFPSLQRP